VSALLRRYGPPLLLGMLALASFWLLRQLDAEREGGTPTPRHVPDFYMENFETTTMGADGQPRRWMQARYMAHFPDTDTHEFDTPVMRMYRDEGPPWHVRSERGWLSSSGDVMLLLGKVHIWRNNVNGIKELDLKTEDLRVLPETSYGETDRPVEITTPTSRTTGVGMKAYLAEDRLELLNDVRTLLQPKRD
jgi:lipopolysaccharide export system protein LptC